MKKNLGQFYTKNYDYILKNINIPNDVNDIIEPFAGEGDLLKYIHLQAKKYDSYYNIQAFDIEPKHKDVVLRDTLLTPPDYLNKFVITNPPYLARNKSANKLVFDKYNVNDLYKCFIKTLLCNNVCSGGILILPINFICYIRANDVLLRKHFVQTYSIVQINIFEETVFHDTTTTVCTIFFTKKTENDLINIDFYPSSKNMKISLNPSNHFTIGGELYHLQKNSTYTFKRLTSKNIQEKNTNILIKCIDDNQKNMICAKMVDDKDVYIDNTPDLSARCYMTLIIQPTISIDQQKKLVEIFNIFLAEQREKYNSLFLPNYRESKDIARKRISFDLVYKIIGHLMN